MAGGEASSSKHINGESKVDLSSLYFIGSQDGPGKVITLIIFRGDNYDELYRSIRLSLMARRKFDFLKGKSQNPPMKGFAILAVSASPHCSMDIQYH